MMQEVGNFNFKINFIPNGLEKYISFNIINELFFIDSFQFLSSSLDGLVRNLSENDFKYLSQEDNENNEDFENSTDHAYVESDVKVRGHCHITQKYRGSAHEDCNIKVKLNHKIHILFHNLKNFDSNFIMQEVGNFNFEINFIPNGLEKYTSFNINNKLIFIDSFQFLSSLLDGLVNTLSKNDLTYLSQESDGNVLDLVKLEGFYPYEYMRDFKKFKEELPSKQKLVIMNRTCS